MKDQTRDGSARIRSVAAVLLLASAILSMPFLAMQFSDEIHWDDQDFALAALLLLGAGTVFILVSTNMSRRQRVLVAAALTASVLYLWAELAVGLFTYWGS